MGGLDLSGLSGFHLDLATSSRRHITILRFAKNSSTANTATNSSTHVGNNRAGFLESVFGVMPCPCKLHSSMTKLPIAQVSIWVGSSTRRIFHLGNATPELLLDAPCDSGNRRLD